MRTLAVGALLLVGLSGCFGFDPASGGLDDFTPGQDWEPTGKTVHLKATVADFVFHEIYPGFQANLWAFCFEPADPTDAYSANAIEYGQRIPTDGLAGIGYQNFEGTCSVPGPTLRVQQGDTVKVDFSHNHFHCHTIHWHGQHVPWEHDGAPGVNQASVCQGESFSYEFVAARAGSLWYHCHVDTHFHVMQGLYGVFIVEPQDDRWEPEDIDAEYLLVYSSLSRELVQVTKERVIDPHKDHRHLPGTCGASGVQGCQSPPVDVTPDTWMLNGRSLPHSMEDAGSVIRVDEGDRVRVRLFNFGETFETIHTHGHDMYVTHRDGNPLAPAARFWVDTLTIGPAERYDVVIEANNPGLWMMHTHVDHQSTNDHQAPGGGMGMIVYRSIEAEQGTMHPFALGSELAGGLPWVEPMVLPTDVSGVARFNATGVGVAAVDISGRAPVPIDQACAVRSLIVEGRFDGGFPDSIARPQGITVSFVDASGGTYGAPASFQPDGTLRLALSPRDGNGTLVWGSGQHGLQLGGTVAGPGTVTLVWALDYATNEELNLANWVLRNTPCDPTLRIFDYIQYAKDNGRWPGA